MTLKPKSPDIGEANIPRLLSSHEPGCCTSEDSHRSLVLTQMDGATEGFPLTWLYRWQWRSSATHELLILTLTDHEVTIHGKHLDGVTELLSNGKGLHLRIKDARYQSLMRPNEILITTINVQPNSKHEPSQN
ncbi:MAG: hypothetical protein HZA93_21100 [Verrucomicrobia bacterium]|nr:hypothetical protein [Verrucomicrobiota bacterium]